MNQINYVFDIDGTLTPSRRPIDPDFQRFFLQWVQNKKVYLISGSDYPKSLEQLGSEILNAVSGCFNTAGNVYYVKGQKKYQNDWNPPTALFALLNDILESSEYPIRAGNHIEQRIGMINFSVVGRDCTYDQRLAYNTYDQKEKEREHVRKQIMAVFPEIEVSIGGQISIDIYPKGHNKAQIVDHLTGPIHFFGDKTMEGGNDYDLASKLHELPNRVTQVKDWQDTWEKLKKEP